MAKKTRVVTDWETELQRRHESLLNYVLLTAAIGGLGALIMEFSSLQDRSALGLLKEVPFVLSWIATVIACIWRGMGYKRRGWIAIGLAYFLGFYTFIRGGLPGSGRLWTLMPIVLAFVLLGHREGLIASAVSVLIYTVFSLLFGLGILQPILVQEPAALESLTNWISEGASFLLVLLITAMLMSAFSRNWVEALAKTSAVNRELEETNAQLYRQATQLQAATEIARAGATILDPNALAVEVVHRIQERFALMGAYYVGLLLFDNTERVITLKAATGEAGRLLLEMGYQEEPNESTAVGWCIARRQPRVVPRLKSGGQIGALPMPHTRSEIALPLISRGRVLGALNIHSSREDAFRDEDVTLLQTLADQISTALENARLFSQTEASLQEAHAIQKSYLARAWRDFLAAQPTTRYEYRQPGAAIGNGGFLRDAQQAAIAHKRTVAILGPSPEENQEAPPQTALVVPLKVRDQVVGTLALHETGRPRPWTPAEIDLAETVAEQVALTVENLRLIEAAQRRAARERAISEIADRMQRATDMETLLRITAEELKRNLGGSRIYVRLETKGDDGHEGEGDRQE